MSVVTMDPAEAPLSPPLGPPFYVDPPLLASLLPVLLPPLLAGVPEFEDESLELELPPLLSLLLF